jgi:hypothetical protein
VGPVGFEPTTSRLSAGCSSQTKLWALSSESFRAGGLSTAALLNQFDRLAERFRARSSTDKEPTSSEGRDTSRPSQFFLLREMRQHREEDLPLGQPVGFDDERSGDDRRRALVQVPERILPGHTRLQRRIPLLDGFPALSVGRRRPRKLNEANLRTRPLYPERRAELPDLLLRENHAFEENPVNSLPLPIGKGDAAQDDLRLGPRPELRILERDSQEVVQRHESPTVAESGVQSSAESGLSRSRRTRDENQPDLRVKAGHERRTEPAP